LPKKFKSELTNGMMRPVILMTGIIALFFYSCNCNNGKEKVHPELKDTTVKIIIDRYEKILFTLDRDSLQQELKKIKPRFSFFLDGDLDDENNIRQLHEYLNDPQMSENYETSQKIFPELSLLEKQLSSAFTYFKYYFPEKKVPRVYTYICGMDYEHPVIYADSMLMIALDMYLGRDYPLYQALGLPLFIRKTMSEEYITRDCMKAVAEYHCYNDMKDATFLDNMIYEGKKQYLIDVMMPESDDTVKFKYSKKQLDWCYENEAKIWAFFIENKLLYSKDNNAIRKFFSEAPFTASFSKDSPPRTGSWIGWRIVSQYMLMDKNLNPQKLISNTDAQQILTLSKYKPRKP